jgi:iron(III) transport system substrate-binding protein
MLDRRSVLAGLACLLGGPGFAWAEDADDWAAVETAAKKERTVVLYSGAPGAPEHPAIAKLFEARYGIKVELLDANGPEISERIRTEVAAGHAYGDVLNIGSNAQNLAHERGLIQPHGFLPNLKNAVLRPNWEGEEVPTFVNPYGILINTRLVPPELEPKSWLDLLDPRWKGKILGYNYWVSGSGATWFGVMQDAFGLQYHEKMALQNVQFGIQVRENPRRVARGEFAIFVPFTITDMGALEGLPLKAIVPREGLAYTPYSLTMIKGAPHPNAARLLMNFFLEPEAQLVYAHNGFPVAIDGLADRVPEKWRWSVNAKLLGRQSLQGQEERMRLASNIYEVR